MNQKRYWLRIGLKLGAISIVVSLLVALFAVMDQFIGLGVLEEILDNTPIGLLAILCVIIFSPAMVYVVMGLGMNGTPPTVISMSVGLVIGTVVSFVILFVVGAMIGWTYERIKNRNIILPAEEQRPGFIGSHRKSIFVILVIVVLAIGFWWSGY